MGRRAIIKDSGASQKKPSNEESRAKKEKKEEKPNLASLNDPRLTSAQRRELAKSLQASGLVGNRYVHNAISSSSERTPDEQGPTQRISEVKKQFYGHGAFMGAAMALLNDPKWNRILKALMPDVWEETMAALKSGNGANKIILMFENNPVMAAYGIYRSGRLDTEKVAGREDRVANIEAFEWDAFLPGNVVTAFKKARTPQEKANLAPKLVDDMLIAHGSTMQTVFENKFGLRQYDSVQASAKTAQGGVTPGAWMDIFGRALQIAGDPDWELKSKEYGNPKRHKRYSDVTDKANYLTLRNRLPFSEVIDLYKEMFNKETFSVVLDVKSRDATPEILQAIVEELNQRGVLVYGVGSFVFGEMRGLKDVSQSVGGKRRAGPREIKFFHFAGDLQNACLNGQIAVGDTAMFNAGSLIGYDRLAGGKSKKASYEVKQKVIEQLREYKEEYGFQLGVYVQENDIDDRAADIITQLCNENPNIFDLGFAWGGISGETAAEIEPSFTDGTVGTASQHLIGSQWDLKKSKPKKK